MGACCAKQQRVAPDKGIAKEQASTGLEPDKKELQKVFKEFDVDGDGFIQMDELRRVLANMGQNVSDEDLEIMFEAADVNRDGGISFEEFDRISRANPMAISLKAVFSDLDADGDGQITKEELRDAFRRLGSPLSDEEAQRICQQADVDLDGKLNFDEFVRMMCRAKK